MRVYVYRSDSRSIGGGVGLRGSLKKVKKYQYTKIQKKIVSVEVKKNIELASVAIG